MADPIDGNGAASSPAQVANADPSQVGAAAQPGNAAPNQQPERSQYVDRARFDEVNNRMKAAEQNATQLTQAAQALYGQMQQQASRLSQLEQQQQTSRNDSEIETIKQPFVSGASDKDAAEQAFDAVYKTADYATKKALQGFKGEMLTELRTIVQQAVAPLHSSTQVSQRATELQKSGRLSAQDAQFVQSEMDREMAVQPQWRAHQELLFDRITGKLALEGKITIMQQGQQPSGGGYGLPPGSPIHSHGGGVPPNTQPPTNTADAELAEIKRRFSRTFGAVPIDKMKSVHAADPTGGQRQQVIDKSGQVQFVESSTLHGSYEHRR